MNKKTIHSISPKTFNTLVLLPMIVCISFAVPIAFRVGEVVNDMYSDFIKLERMIDAPSQSSNFLVTIYQSMHAISSNGNKAQKMVQIYMALMALLILLDAVVFSTATFRILRVMRTQTKAMRFSLDQVKDASQCQTHELESKATLTAHLVSVTGQVLRSWWENLIQKPAWLFYTSNGIDEDLFQAQRTRRFSSRPDLDQLEEFQHISSIHKQCSRYERYVTNLYWQASLVVLVHASFFVLSLILGTRDRLYLITPNQLIIILFSTALNLLKVPAESSFNRLVLIITQWANWTWVSLPHLIIRCDDPGLVTRFREDIHTDNQAI